MEKISGYHAHVYFDETTIEQAQQLCENATSKFSVEMGRMHHKKVGPHPHWSCQLAFSSQQFSEVVPWLALHRDGLTILVHPQSGDDLRDHRDYAIWMGQVAPLNLAIFTK